MNWRSRFACGLSSFTCSWMSATASVICAGSAVTVDSCVVHPCFFVPTCPLSRFPLSCFQRPMHCHHWQRYKQHSILVRMAFFFILVFAFSEHVNVLLPKNVLNYVYSPCGIGLYVSMRRNCIMQNRQWVMGYESWVTCAVIKCNPMSALSCLKTLMATSLCIKTLLMRAWEVRTRLFRKVSGICAVFSAVINQIETSRNDRSWEIQRYAI